MSSPAFRPGKDPLFDQNAITIDVDSCSLYALRDAVGKKNLERTIRIHHVFDVRDPYRHLASVAFRDRLQPWGSFEMTACLQSNAKTQADADRFEIDDAAHQIRTLIVLEATLFPQTLVASTNRRADVVDSTTPFVALMHAVFTGTFIELVDAQNRAAKRTWAARPRRSTTFALS